MEIDIKEIYINRITYWDDGHTDFKCITNLRMNTEEFKSFKTQVIML